MSALDRLADVSAANWLSETGADAVTVITWGPAGFPSYARLRYLPDPSEPGMCEADVAVAEDRPSDLDQARIVLSALGDPAQRCYCCVWEGWVGSHLDPALTRGPLVELPHRRYVLFTGVLGDIEGWDRMRPPPAFVWPADRSWCFTSDVDPHWAGIGASAAAIRALTLRSDIDVVPGVPTRQPLGYTG